MATELEKKMKTLSPEYQAMVEEIAGQLMAMAFVGAGTEQQSVKNAEIALNDMRQYFADVKEGITPSIPIDLTSDQVDAALETMQGAVKGTFEWGKDTAGITWGALSKAGQAINARFSENFTDVQAYTIAIEYVTKHAELSNKPKYQIASKGIGVWDWLVENILNPVKAGFLALTSDQDYQSILEDLEAQQALNQLARASNPVNELRNETLLQKDLYDYIQNVAVAEGFTNAQGETIEPQTVGVHIAKQITKYHPQQNILVGTPMGATLGSDTARLIEAQRRTFVPTLGEQANDFLADYGPEGAVASYIALRVVGNRLANSVGGVRGVASAIGSSTEATILRNIVLKPGHQFILKPAYEATAHTLKGLSRTTKTLGAAGLLIAPAAGAAAAWAEGEDAEGIVDGVLETTPLSISMAADAGRHGEANALWWEHKIPLYGEVYRPYQRHILPEILTLLGDKNPNRYADTEPGMIEGALQSAYRWATDADKRESRLAMQDPLAGEATTMVPVADPVLHNNPPLKAPTPQTPPRPEGTEPALISSQHHQGELPPEAVAAILNSELAGAGVSMDEDNLPTQVRTASMRVTDATLATALGGGGGARFNPFAMHNSKPMILD
jgi:hypothetical protein